MKISVKQLLTAAAVLMLSAPAIAAENDNTPRAMTKGTKSYQSTRTDAQTTTADVQQDGQDVSEIAPAAGDQAQPETTQSKLQDNLRLPRKH